MQQIPYREILLCIIYFHTVEAALPSSEQQKWLVQSCTQIPVALHITNPFDSRLTQELSIIMPDNHQREKISLNMINPTFLWQRFITYDNNKTPHSLSSQRSWSHILSGSGIAALGVLGFITGPWSRSTAKVSYTLCGAGLSMLWMTYQLNTAHREIDNAHSRITTHRLKQHTHAIFEALLIAQVHASTRETESSIKSLEQQTEIIHRSQQTIGTMNTQTRTHLNTIERSMMQSSHKIDSCMLNDMSWVHTLLEKIIHEAYDSLHQPRGQEWRWLEMRDFALLTQEFQKQWCHRCNNAGHIAKKICGTCAGNRLTLVKHKNGQTNIILHKDHNLT